MTEKAFQKIKAGLEDARDMLAAAPAAPAQEPVGVADRTLAGSPFAIFDAAKVPVGTKLYAAPVAPVPVAVKALEFDGSGSVVLDFPHSYWVDGCPDRDGEYFVRVGWRSIDDELDLSFPSIEAAKAAAQADYERRVRACLVDAPASTVRYRNWRGEVADRQIVPLAIWFGSTDWHPEPQLLLKAWDAEKQAERDFALADFLPPEGAPVAAGWQAIESAPKDGTVILVGHARAVFTAWWDDGHGWVDGLRDSDDALVSYPPTHWMPLPAAPGEG